MSDRRRVRSSDLEVDTCTGKVIAPERKKPGLPTLTVVYHPNLARVGEYCILPQLDGRGVVEVSRLTPGFLVAGSDDAVPLADRYISRRPVRLKGGGQAGLVVEREEDGMPVWVDGQSIERRRAISLDEINEGVVLSLAHRVVLFLHRRRPPRPIDDDLGIVGASDAVLRLRRHIADVADLNVPVLVRGETGSGKELVAQALHRLGGRSGPIQAVNISAIAPTLVASELFGHAKGAFSGAERARKGLFEQADGGTLFLDEIGDAPADVQVMLLRALETGEVRPVGAGTSRRVDVRVVAATDANLSKAVEDGRFREPLLHRLAGYEIDVPPLRARRDDVGRLLVHFLEAELARVGESWRLEKEAGRALWLATDIVDKLARHPWPGNVRQFRNVVRQIVISGRGTDHVTVDGPLERVLEEAQAPPAGREAGPDHTSASDSSQLDAPGLRDALRRTGYGIAATAKMLGLSKNGLYALMQRHGVRTARDIDADELRETLTECGSPAAAAERLEVSERALKLRLKELGLS